MAARRTHEDYTLGWICPMEIEQIPAVSMLDERHGRLQQRPADSNIYTLGSIAGYNVVIAGLHVTGNNPAALVVSQMRNTFPNLKFVLLVGIGGGVPMKTDSGVIRLGDVVVSEPEGKYPGVVQYDRGKAQTGRFKRTGALPPPPVVLLQAAKALAIDRVLAGHGTDPIDSSLARVAGLEKFRFPGRGNDQLYPNHYVHQQPGMPCRESGCDPTRSLPRDSSPREQEKYVRVHRGLVASGEMVIRDAVKRDQLATQSGILCFETEAAGVLTDTPCLVIRGIANYCDSHKTDLWNGYAAAAAAAYARELILRMPDYRPTESPIAESSDVALVPAAVQGSPHLPHILKSLQPFTSRSLAPTPVNRARLLS